MEVYGETIGERELRIRQTRVQLTCVQNASVVWKNRTDNHMDVSNRVASPALNWDGKGLRETVAAESVE